MQDKKTILITGGTGLIGSRLAEMLVAMQQDVIVLTRQPELCENKPGIRYAHWDPEKNSIDESAGCEAEVIFHLAGAGVVDKRWTKAYKQKIVDSRVAGSQLIFDTLRQHSHKTKAIISSSAIGWYGADVKPGYAFVETDPADSAYLGETCKLWEQSIDQARELGIRVCKLRTGIVLSEKGGALAEFIKPLKWGLATILGNGKQIISWIHIDDLCRMFIYAMQHETLQGSYNAVSPEPVSNKNLVLTLAKIMKGNFFIPMMVPSFILKIMMGESSIEVLKSTHVSCDKIIHEGFEFQFPEIHAALKHLTHHH